MSEPINQDVRQIKDENQKQEETIRTFVSKAAKEYQATGDVSDETAQEVGKYGPQVVAQSLFNFPPVIKVGKELMQPTIMITPPSPIDVEYSQKDISQISGPDEATANLPVQYAQLLKEYLSLPFVNDGFSKHETQRWPWQHTLVKTLDQIGQKVSGDKTQFSLPFLAIWDSNKATTNKINNIKMSLSNMDWLSEDPSYQEELKPLLEAIDNEAVNQDKSRSLQDTERISGIARGTLDLLSKYFTKPQV